MARSLLPAVLSLALLAACGDDDAQPRPVALGRPLDADVLCELQLDVSTMDDVTARFGAAPLAGPASGEMLVQYVYVDADGAVQESTLFWFDDAGILRSVDRVKAELPACLQPQQ
jgi:hypothetical protein